MSGGECNRYNATGRADLWDAQAAGLVHTLRMQPTADEVRAQLDRLLESDGLATASRLRRFLRYIVERSLAGEADQLKEYTIGVDVFDRSSGYDPRIDSIVRVEAGRLRAKVDAHYREAGAGDPVIITIPRGSYVPSFERRARPAPAESARAGVRRAWRPAFGMLAAGVLVLGAAAWWTSLQTTGARPAPALTIAVLPFAQYSNGPGDELLAARLADGVRSELVRIGALGVVSRTSIRQFEGDRRPLREVADALQADILVEASVVADGDRVRVQARLVDGAVDRKSWMHDFEGTRSDLEDLQRRIAEGITAAARPSR